MPLRDLVQKNIDICQKTFAVHTWPHDLDKQNLDNIQFLYPAHWPFAFIMQATTMLFHYAVTQHCAFNVDTLGVEIARESSSGH